MIESSLSDLAVRARIKSLISPSSPANIPSCLKSLTIWYPFRFTPRAKGGLGKPPCDRQGNFATGWQDPSTYMSFEEATGLNMDGVGIVIHEELGLTGIDFDHCVKDGVITDPWVAQKVKELNSYTEYSVSGTGIHVLVWGRLPWAKFTGRIEMKDRSGFLTLTGNRVPGTPAEIRSAQDTIDALHLEVFGAPDGQMEQISVTQQNQQVSPNPNTSLPEKKRGKGKLRKEGVEKRAQRFDIQPAAKLSSDVLERLNNLQDEKPMFKATREKSRSAGFWPFRSDRYTSSEYEASIACFLLGDGWDEQSIMDVICVWRREHGFTRRMEYCRYACTLSKAAARVATWPNRTGSARKESQGLYKHAETKERILGCIIETPRTPKQIAEVTGITQATVYVVIGRLRKDNKVIRDRHTYLCAPHAVPWYLRTPDELVEDYDAEQETGNSVSIAELDVIEAEYQEFIAMATAEDVIIGIDEPIEAPDMVSKPPVALHEVIMPDWSGYPAAIVHVMAPAEPYAVVRARNEALDVQNKLEGRQRLAAYRKKYPDRPSMARMKRDAKARKVLARRQRDEDFKRQWLAEHGTMVPA